MLLRLADVLVDYFFAHAEELLVLVAHEIRLLLLPLRRDLTGDTIFSR